MSGTKREYQLLIYKHDAEWADPAVPEVEWTFGDDVIAEGSPNTYGGQIVRLIRGRTESRPWSLTLSDAAEQITQKLADANGRAQMLLRLATLQKKDDDGSWTNEVTARLTDVVSSEETEYTFTFEDERVKERNVTLFPEADTVTVYPGGLCPEYTQFYNFITNEHPWSGAYPGPLARYFYFKVLSKSGDAVLIQVTGDQLKGPNGGAPGVWEVALNVISEDVQIRDAEPRVSGNFEHLRLFYRTDIGVGTDVEIRYFGGAADAYPALSFKTQEGAEEAIKKMMLYWPSCPLNAGQTRLGYLYAPTRPPDSIMPFHIGYLNDDKIPGPLWFGAAVEPFSLVKLIYDGGFQGSTATPTTIRYNADAFSDWDPVTNPIGLIGNPRVSLHGLGFRITQPATMSEWLEDNIYGPFGVVPFVDEDGVISPRPVTLPTADEIDIATLPELTDATVADEGEEWRHPRREIITRVIVNYYPNTGSPFFYTQDPNKPPWVVDSLDLMQMWPSPITYEHDLIDRFGVEEIQYELQIHHLYFATWRAEDLARSVLQRYGDGPQYTRLKAMPGAPDLAPGDFVKVSASFWPKLHQVPPTRGDVTLRIGQVVQKVKTDVAPNYVILDIGPSLQPLGTLTVGCALNGTDSDWVDITISGLPAGALYRLQYTVDTGTVTHDDPMWVQRHTGSANETITIKGLPKGAKTHWRAQAYKEGRISGLWSNICVVTVAALTAPHTCSVTAYSATSAVVGWKLGELKQPLEILLDGVHFGYLNVGTRIYTFPYLEPDTTYTVGIRHFDSAGGVSGICEVIFTTLPADTDPICQPVDMVLWQGGACS